MSMNLFTRFILSASLLMLWSTLSHAEWFIKYEFVPELGYLQVRSQEVQGEEYIDHMLERREDYAEKGIYFGHGEDAPKVYLHTDTLAGHTIKTRIMVYAPAMVGYGGANWTATVEIEVDGIEKVSCHIGYYAPEQKSVDSITVFPLEDIIRVFGSMQDGYVFDIETATIFISEQEVITHESLVARKSEYGKSSSKSSGGPSRGLRDRLVDDMKGQIVSYLEATDGTAPVADILENTHGIGSAMFVALYDLRDDGKVTWPGGEDAALSLSVMVSLVGSSRV